MRKEQKRPLNSAASLDAVAYLRVSSKEQQDGFSIPAQRKMYNEYAKNYSINVVDEFVDIESAKKAGRKQFNRMLEALKDNKDIKIVFVEKTDRLYRNPNDWITMEELGVEIHFI